MEFLFNLSEEWTPIRDIPQTKLNHFHLSLLSSVGAIETEQEYDIRLLNGETQTARITNHGWREDNDRSMPVETRELIAKFLPDVDIDCEINIRAIAVRPTSSGIEIRDSPDQETGISMLVEAINDPLPYSVGNLYVVPEKITGRDDAEVKCFGLFIDDIDAFTKTAKRYINHLSTWASCVIKNEDQCRLLQALVDSNGKLTTNQAHQLLPRKAERDNACSRLKGHLQELQLTIKNWEIVEFSKK